MAEVGVAIQLSDLDCIPCTVAIDIIEEVNTVAVDGADLGVEVVITIQRGTIEDKIIGRKRAQTIAPSATGNAAVELGCIKAQEIGALLIAIDRIVVFFNKGVKDYIGCIVSTLKVLLGEPESVRATASEELVCTSATDQGVVSGMTG